MACESYFKVKLIFYRNNLILDPGGGGGGGGMGKAPCGVMVKLHFGSKNQVFPYFFFKGFVKSCLCARNEEVT